MASSSPTATATGMVGKPELLRWALRRRRMPRGLVRGAARRRGPAPMRRSDVARGGDARDARRRRHGASGLEAPRTPTSSASSACSDAVGVPRAVLDVGGVRRATFRACYKRPRRVLLPVQSRAPKGLQRGLHAPRGREDRGVLASAGVGRVAREGRRARRARRREDQDEGREGRRRRRERCERCAPRRVEESRREGLFYLDDGRGRSTRPRPNAARPRTRRSSTATRDRVGAATRPEARTRTRMDRRRRGSVGCVLSHTGPHTDRVRVVNAIP